MSIFCVAEWPLDAELAQVVIHVLVMEAPPLFPREYAEKRVLGLVRAVAGGEAIEQALERADVGAEFTGRGAVLRLVELHRRRLVFRSSRWGVEKEGFDGAVGEGVSDWRRTPLAETDATDVSQMADHLVGRHQP